jgi:ATP-dependent Clp protease ATP-binding subunit ClpA
MFERFQQDARMIVVSAQEESRDLGHNRIGTVHLLLGLAKDEDGTAGHALREHGVRLDDLRARVVRLAGAGNLANPLDGQALAAIGIDLDEVRRTVEASFGAGALDRGRRTKGHLPFTPQANKSLERSLRSAIALKHKSICSGHLLLGLLRATGSDNLALQVLADAGALRSTADRLLRAKRRLTPVLPSAGQARPAQPEEITSRQESWTATATGSGCRPPAASAPRRTRRSHRRWRNRPRAGDHPHPTETWCRGSARVP